MTSVRKKARNTAVREDLEVRICDASLPIFQSVWRKGRTAFFFRTLIGNFKATSENGVAVEGELCTTLSGNPCVYARWSRDGVPQSGTFVLRIADLAACVINVIGRGECEELAGKKDKTSIRLGRRS